MNNFNRNELKNKTLEEFRPPQEPVRMEPHDSYDAEEELHFFDKFKLIVPIIIIAIVCFVAYSWYTDKFAISNSSTDLPVVKATNLPLREKPEDPGGMKIINRDKKVYDAISGKDNDKDTPAANILPAPEEPIAPEAIVKKDSPEVIDKLDEKDKNTASDIIKTPIIAEVKDVAPKNAAIAPPAANITTQATANIAPVKTEALAADEAKTAVAETTAKVKAVTEADITDVAPKKQVITPNKVKKVNLDYRVQLGSYRQTGDAEASWKLLQKKFPEILINLNDYIEKAVLGDKGTFYRLQLTGFKNEADARKVCQKLTEKKQGCFFVGK